MPSPEALRVFLQSLARRSYYDLLRVPLDASSASVKAGFHEFSLQYHPDRFVDSPPEVGRTATEIYKRGVEAYRCLSRTASRERYDRGLALGRLRLEEDGLPTQPLSPEVRTLGMVASTPRGKQLALKADRLIDVGQLDDARVQLASACQNEPHNEELAERLQLLYEALALGPL